MASEKLKRSSFEAVGDPQFAAGAALMVRSLMERLGIKEATLDLSEDPGPGGMEVAIDGNTLRVRLKTEEELEQGNSPFQSFIH